MSDESSVTTPEPGESASTDAAPADVAPADAASRPASRLYRMMPSWARRRPLLAGFGAGIVAAALIAGGVYEAQLPSGPPRGAYTLPPKQPCAMISAAELATYLPGATGTPVTVAVSGPVKEGVCKWSSATGGEVRTLTAQVLVFGSRSSVSLAQQAYHDFTAEFGCHCPGVTARSQPVSGVGDQAAEAFVSAGPAADYSDSPSATWPGTSLFVRSSNAVVTLTLDTTATATGASLAKPPGDAQLAAMISMARGVVAVLAQPGSAPAGTSAPLSPEPHYAGRRDPCRLITGGTLARYAPSATLELGQIPSSSQNQRQSAGCAWGSDNTFVLLTLNTFPGAASAWQYYQADAASLGRSGNGVTGTQWLPDIGESAAAIFMTESGHAGVEMLVWSGNVELQYWYASTSGPSRPRAELLAGAIAMSRDSLAALSSPAVSSFLPEPRYASPRDACALVKPSTLARYVPGAMVDKLPATGGGSGVPQSSGCDWTADSTGILLTVTIAAGPDSATGFYQFGIREDKKNQDGSKFLRAQPVHGVGEQATAVYQKRDGDTPDVTLDVLSGNAVVEVNSSDVGISPPLSQAGKLAADTAVARDVLASLRHS